MDTGLAKPRLGLEALTPAWGPSQPYPTPGPAHPEGLGELLQGGEGDGVRPRLSRPAEATSELLVGTDNIDRTKKQLPRASMSLSPNQQRQGRGLTHYT